MTCAIETNAEAKAQYWLVPVILIPQTHLVWLRLVPALKILRIT